jgi:four helix bundle protein
MFSSVLTSCPFAFIALGSSDETQVWLQYCIDLEYMDKGQGTMWVACYQEVSRMLQGLIKKFSDI